MDKVYNFLVHFHSGWVYLVAIFSIILLMATLYHFFTKKPLNRNIRKISFYTVLSFHIQFLVGLLLYIVSPKIRAFWSNGLDMSNPIERLLTVEHPLMMFTAVILMTIANAKIKRTQLVNWSIIIFIVMAILCFYMIPWTQWMAFNA